MNQIKERYLKFIQSTDAGGGRYKLTPVSDVTPFARCFAIFGYHLLRSEIKNREFLAQCIIKDLDDYREQRVRSQAVLSNDKPYLQLLMFSLSALSVLDSQNKYLLEGHIEPLLPHSVVHELNVNSVFSGVPRSGNYAMFLAVILIYAEAKLGIDIGDMLSEWVSSHLNCINAHGFWGNVPSMSFLQFQNGYHQYEILHYLQVDHAPWELAANSVALLADSDGHFAPYPGGGGCYDYDAIFMLTTKPYIADLHRDLLLRTMRSIIREQNVDGGFCESKMVRPITLRYFNYFIRNIALSEGRARKERIRQFLTLMRPKYNSIATHWSLYNRKWQESDLWDSWFRMLAIARIDSMLNDNRESWGFIDFPGIGYY